ncbi:MAG: hemolysin family protein [Vulcanimicrobiota bacterium]
MWAVAFIVLLVSANALFVAAEFSTVASRKTRLASMAERGDKTAGWLLGVVGDSVRLDRYVAAAQLGITLSSLVLGFYGQTRLAVRLEPYAQAAGLPEGSVTAATATAVLLVLTGLQVIFGELLPKSLGLQFPEQLARLASYPMRAATSLMSPLISFFNGSARLLMKLLRLPEHSGHGHLHSADEIRMLVGESKTGGVLDEVESQLLDNALRVRNYTAHQAMVPRNRLTMASVDTPLSELLKLVAESPFSRLPVYQDSPDKVVGVVHIKDLLANSRAAEPRPVSELVREAPAVPHTLTVKKLMARLQKDHFHMAVVLDEYGGTAGIVTLEDLLERIFGDFQDEYDPVAFPLRMVGERIEVSGSALLEELNSWFDLALSSLKSDTLAGLMLEHLGRLARVGDEVPLGGLSFRVDQLRDRALEKVSIPADHNLVQRLRKRGLLS